jgi:hypothetical protein
VVSFEFEDLVFYSKLLPLEIGDHFWIWCRPADFFIELCFKAGMPGTEAIETILKRHWRLQSAIIKTIHRNPDRAI